MNFGTLYFVNTLKLLVK